MGIKTGLLETFEGSEKIKKQMKTRSLASNVIIKPQSFNSFYWKIYVSDGKGWDQPACQEEWKICRKERRIVMPM
jgi:hypothetical protein